MFWRRRNPLTSPRRSKPTCSWRRIASPNKGSLAKKPSIRSPRFGNATNVQEQFTSPAAGVS